MHSSLQGGKAKGALVFKSVFINVSMVDIVNIGIFSYSGYYLNNISVHYCTVCILLGTGHLILERAVSFVKNDLGFHVSKD